MALSKERLLGLYRDMVLIRKFEDCIKEYAANGTIPGFVHLSTGQEACQAGVVRALRTSDFKYPDHRGHGAILLCGTDPKLVMAEIFGKATGVNGGRGGSMHVHDWTCHNHGFNGIQGSTTVTACGTAFASKYLKTVAGEEWEDYDYVKTVPAFTVTFVADGQTVDTQTVVSGEDATLPEVPAKEGYTGEWDSDGKNITTDTTITAQYEKISTGGNAGDNDNPDTGDSSNLILWSVLGIASLLCVAVLLVILYRKKGKYQSR